MIKQLPKQSLSNSQIWLFRLPHSLEYTNSLLKDGARLVVADIDTKARAAAVTLPASSKLARDVSNILNRPEEVKSVILIRLQTHKLTLAHENQTPIGF